MILRFIPLHLRLSGSRAALAIVLLVFAGIAVPSTCAQDGGDRFHPLSLPGWQQQITKGFGKTVRAVYRLEFARMLGAILGGSRMGPGDGWFGPSHSRYNWEWLAERFDKDGDGEINKQEMEGAEKIFARLDRNGDGVIVAGDFDWSPNSPFVRAQSEAAQFLRMYDENTNGRISKEEWENFFKKLAQGKDHLTPEDLQRFLSPPQPRTKTEMKKQSGPTPQILFKGLFAGELGSPFHGPKVGDPAPDFTLKTLQTGEAISLSQYRGKKPVVLIFGSFT